MFPPGEALAWAQAVVDVRSPVEFEQGAIAGAVNIPLFSNHERAEIGTLYKQVGRDPALSLGMNLVEGRLAEYAARFEPYRNQRVVVCCARGGMRSRSVAQLLVGMGYQAAQLAGGYKAFRNYLLKELETMPPRMVVIHGQTGVGKTRVLRKLNNAVDLEGLAQHRSSLFGAVNLSPRSQQWFESLLLQRLKEIDPTKPVWIEGESRKVGDIILPNPLFRAMKGAVCVLLTAPLQVRVQRIIAEYAREDPATLEQLAAALGALTPMLGKARVADLTAHLRRGDLEAVVAPLLEEYYDLRYAHAMRNYTYAQTFDAADEEQTARALEAWAVPRE